MNKLLLSLLCCLGAWAGLYAQTLDMTQFHGFKARNIGPAGMSGRVTSIAVDPTDTDNIYLGAAAGGIWKSENAGHTWTPIFDQQAAASIGDIEIYAANPNIIYVGTGEGNPRNSQNSGRGMFKTTDGGKNWTQIGLENTRQIHRVLIAPDNPNVVLAGVSGATWGDAPHRGVYRSTDGGESWEKTLYVNERTGIADMVMDPHNPNRIVAAMYEHRRWPWFYQSGGPGSGIYISLDGGQSWEKTSEGLPDGDLGRIGLSFAPSAPDMIYAYVESKSNAVYRSVDGGKSWARQSKPGDSHIGSRPFYYADIYVDPQNENRIYSIASVVNVSEDGGKSWRVFAAGNKIHTDHHAWWAHPTDSDFLMVGHDGGLNITHDRGKNWWFADNLPLAQFYHMRLDNALPYNLYGGLQDNGSWIGPSQVRFKGGIRNMYWQRVSVGDGFDVVPDPQDLDFGYSMGQAGTLYRYQRSSGQLQVIKPVHPEGEYLRFNWNAGIAIDPFDEKTIYYGSQYLHKSTDKGNSWTIISPDLTTNNPEKQRFLESGGLTYDVTGAENHTTIISIAPSPLEEGLLWVGTDDGNVQLTRDGGQQWTNLTTNIKGVPEATWVPQITPSKHDPAEAFVVFDDHRRDNWTPYLFRTRDYGQSWERIAGPSDVDGFLYCFEQDPIASNLYFCGTEFGLYVSFDAGKNWNKWTVNFPTMPVSDLAIHPRDHDLAIATFGRAFWILDDIQPLREIAQKGASSIQEEALHLFPVADAYLWNIGESIGYRHGKIGDALYNGENRAYGALVSWHLKEKTDAIGEMTLEAINAKGETVRTLYLRPKIGINRINWKLDRDRPRMPGQAKPEGTFKAGGGEPVLPGTYTLRLKYGDHIQEQQLVVHPDPEIKCSMAEMEETDKLIQRFHGVANSATAIMDKVRSYEESLAFLQKKSASANFPDSLKTAIDKTKQAVQDIRESILGKEAQGIYRNPNALNSVMGAASYQVSTPQLSPSPNRQLIIRQLENALSLISMRFSSFERKQLQELKVLLKAHGISIL